MKKDERMEKDLINRIENNKLSDEDILFLRLLVENAFYFVRRKRKLN